MKIASWNVNSIRSRLNHVIDWLDNSRVDVLCLQETKVVDQDFPQPPFLELGYHLAISGQKAYNGVAIISRSPLTQVQAGFQPLLGEQAADLDSQKRLLAGVIEGVQLVNLYVPNGSTIGSDKYTYKLHWLRTLRDYLHQLVEEQPATIICGDFNIALENSDIHDPELAETHIMASPPERGALQSILDVGFKDVFRKFTSEGGTTVGGIIERVHFVEIVAGELIISMPPPYPMTQQLAVPLTWNPAGGRNPVTIPRW